MARQRSTGTDIVGSVMSLFRQPKVTKVKARVPTVSKKKQPKMKVTPKKVSQEASGDEPRAIRVAQRFDLTASVELTSTGGCECGSGTVRNLSTSGALIEPGTMDVPVGTSITVLFTVIADATNLTVTGRVARFTSEGLAVSFVAPDERFRAVVSQVVPKLASKTEGAWRFRMPDKDPKKDKKGRR